MCDEFSLMAFQSEEASYCVCSYQTDLCWTNADLSELPKCEIQILGTSAKKEQKKNVFGALNS